MCPKGLKITRKGCGVVENSQSQTHLLCPRYYQQECVSEMSRSEPEAPGGGLSIKIQLCVWIFVCGYFYEDVMERVVISPAVVHTWLIHQWLGGTFSETVKPQTMQNSTPRGTSSRGW